MTAEKQPSLPGKDTIYLEAEDEITAIIDKVDGAKQKVVALVLPKRQASLQSIVNMRLLKRSADNAGKNIVLITADAALLPLAGAAGIHVAKNLQSKPEVPAGPAGAPEPASIKAVPIAGIDPVDEGDADDLPNKIDYDRSIGELAEGHELEHPETIELGDDEEASVETAAAATEKLPKAPKDKALKVPNFNKFRLWLGLGIAGFVALIVFIILALFVLPKATIAIQTTSTPVSANLSLKTSGSVTSYQKSSQTIPGFSKTSDQTSTQQVTATGQQNNGTKATGSVTLSGGACTGNVPSDVPAGTGVSTNGLTYVTQKTASFSPVVSGGKCSFQSNQVGITAQTGGTKYNTSLNGASVAGYPEDSASGSASGGTDNIQTVVSQTDVDGVKQKLVSANSDSFSKNFENQLANQGFYVLTSTLNQGDPNVSASPAVGQPASNTTVTVKITYTVLAVKKADLKQAISDALSDQIDSSKQKLDDTTVLSDADISVSNQSSPTNATLSIAENTSAVPLLDAASIKKQVAGKKTGDVTSSISAIPGVKAVNVKLSPFWVSKVPTKTGKITVTIQHINGS